jgi:hypothetical protein
VTSPLGTPLGPHGPILASLAISRQLAADRAAVPPQTTGNRRRLAPSTPHLTDDLSFFHAKMTRHCWASVRVLRFSQLTSERPSRGFSNTNPQLLHLSLEFTLQNSLILRGAPAKKQREMQRLS